MAPMDQPLLAERSKLSMVYGVNEYVPWVSANGSVWAGWFQRKMIINYFVRISWHSTKLLCFIYVFC